MAAQSIRVTLPRKVVVDLYPARPHRLAFRLYIFWRPIVLFLQRRQGGPPYSLRVALQPVHPSIVAVMQAVGVFDLRDFSKKIPSLFCSVCHLKSNPNAVSISLPIYKGVARPYGDLSFSDWGRIMVSVANCKIYYGLLEFIPACCGL